MHLNDTVGTRGAQDQRRAFSLTNAEWLAALQGNDAGRALEDLRALLLDGLRSGLENRRGRFTADDIEDFVQDALIRITRNLHHFRGESMFTTWAQRIAMHVACSELRRKHWRNLSLDEAAVESSRDAAELPGNFHHSYDHPYDSTATCAARADLEATMRATLTDRQCQALMAVILQEISIDELARSMNTNRNALYKLLYDARRRMRAAMRAKGIAPEDLLADLEEAGA
jgi:RNA polymerase sigma-70 factor (ECF subfamily)